MAEHVWEVRVRGPVADDLLAGLGATDICEEPAQTVVLTGPIEQAALHAILRQIRNLGLDLLEVRSIPQTENPPG